MLLLCVEPSASSVFSQRTPARIGIGSRGIGASGLGGSGSGANGGGYAWGPTAVLPPPPQPPHDVRQPTHSQQDSPQSSQPLGSAGFFAAAGALAPAGEAGEQHPAPLPPVLPADVFWPGDAFDGPAFGPVDLLAVDLLAFGAFLDEPPKQPPPPQPQQVHVPHGW